MQVHITIGNSLSQIKNHDEDFHEELFQTLRFMDQAVEFGYRSASYRVRRINDLLNSSSITDKEHLRKELKRQCYILKGLEDKLWKPLYDDEGYFPTGLLTRVLKMAEERKIKVELIDQRTKPNRECNFVLKESLPPLRYYQKLAAQKLEQEHRGVVVMPTGTGKTKTACRMIQDLGVKTLVITPSKAIVDLMVEELSKYFGKGKVQQITTKATDLKEINVTNIQALINLDPKLFTDVKAVIIDEFHHAAADTYLVANEEHLKNCYYRIGLTATNFRNDGADIALEAVLENILYEYPIGTAISDGYLMKPEFEIVPIRLEEEQNYQRAYSKQIVKNSERNRLIADIARAHEDDSVLILVKQVAHGEALEKLLPNSKFVQGITKDDDRGRALEDFRKGRLKCLIGTTVIGEGVDLPVANVLIMAGGGKARSQVMQNVGRVLRICDGKPTPLVYDFTDSDENWLEEHSSERQEIYKLYKIKA